MTLTFDPKDNPLWAERYRPRKVADTVLPPRIKTVFSQSVEAGVAQNMLAFGPPGTGKTTVLKAMCDELQADTMFINGSLKNGIDILRNEIQEFASASSLMGGRKYVLLDEADNLTQATQLALRSFIETYSHNTGFLLTCNHPMQISEAIRSRCAPVDFKFKKDEKPALASEIYKRLVGILEQEKVPFKAPVLVKVVKRFFPDFRSTLVELQQYALCGSIDEGILANLDAADMSALFKNMKEKDFTSVRKWCGENSDHELIIYRKLYDKASELLAPEQVPELILILARYQYQSAFVVDKEVNLAACLAEIMGALEFK